MSVNLQFELQLNEIQSDVNAMTAVVRPILRGVLLSLKQDVAEAAGGRDRIPLWMLGRLRREGDGDVGICFEYAVHDACLRQDGAVVDRINEALKKCKIGGSTAESLLFGLEKSGSLDVINNVKNRLTPDSLLMPGTRGRPIQLRKQIDRLASAFKNRRTRLSLPTSISGLWKADLFLGNPDSDKWVGTSVKLNPSRLEAANGLRIGLVPAAHMRSDAVVLDETKNLIVCPLPYDGSFVQTFYEALEIVQQVLATDAEMPREQNLPNPSHRQVARRLVERRKFSVTEVIEALGPISQTNMVKTENKTAKMDNVKGRSSTDLLIVPSPSVNG